MRAVPGLVEVELVVERLLVEERQESDSPAQERLAVLADRGGGEPGPVVSRGEIVHGEAHDHEIVRCSWPGLRGKVRPLVPSPLAFGSSGAGRLARARAGRRPP